MLRMQEIAFPGFKFQTQTPLGIHARYVGRAFFKDFPVGGHYLKRDLSVR
jgi:hypothetical protein